MKIYLVPGLGNDYRIFSRLVKFLKYNDLEFIEYIEPPAIKTTMQDYAQLIIDKYNIQSDSILIGMSMGGTLAVELAKRISFKRIILISTFKHKRECPLIFRIARFFPIYRLVPAFFIRIFIPMFARLLRICNKAETSILRKMLNDRSNLHFAWGRWAIVHWENKLELRSIIHINGTNDHIFLKANKHADHLIEGGTHNMIMDRAEEISQIINEALE